MEKIKRAKIAGTFYPETESDLNDLISTFKKSSYPKSFKTRAVIVPHAGLVYSGNLAMRGLSLLNPQIETVFIFAPAHRVPFTGIVTSSFDSFETPLGNIEIDTITLEDLKEKFNVKENDEALEFEHSIEIQLPLIQSLFEDMKVVPVLIGMQEADLITEIIENYYEDKKFGFIISSDLSHFLNDENAKKIDNYTANMVETGNIKGFHHEQACGATGIKGLINFANKKGFSLIREGLINSSDITGDKGRVVGYGAWALYEGKRNEFLKEYYSKFILDLTKEAIKTKGKEIKIQVPEVLHESGALFVTLEKEGRLRGCIGSIIAHRPLIQDLIINARNSAFFDPRFNPVAKDEIESLQIAVSILSEPVKMEFRDENDLLNQIVQGKDGIIIKDLGYQAVYLPSVWEQLPDKREFLNSLKMKAGLPPDHFSKSFEAFRFYSTYIK